jgi:hypothetical protein
MFILSTNKIQFMKIGISFLTCLLLVLILTGCLPPPDMDIPDPPRFILDVAVQGQGNVSGIGINCPSYCTSSYDEGSSITIKAEPSSGYYFSGWSGACEGTSDCIVVMNANKVVNANFQTITQSPEPQLGSWYVPPPGIKWHWQLQGTVNFDYPVELYSLDVFDTLKSNIDTLKNRGVKVICYFSAGSAEPWRSDYTQFPTSVIGNKMSGWNEYWLDVRNYDKFASIMRARMDLAVEKGCHGIEPDNLNAYEENSGFPLTYDDQIIYNKWLAEEAHSRNLSIALKYGIGQVNDLLDYYDFVINEQCFQYNECDEFKAFINAGKAVLGVEYELSTSQFCSKANAMNYSWMRMNYDLDGKVRETCWPE